MLYIYIYIKFAYAAEFQEIHFFLDSMIYSYTEHRAVAGTGLPDKYLWMAEDGLPEGYS